MSVSSPAALRSEGRTPPLSLVAAARASVPALPEAQGPGAPAVFPRVVPAAAAVRLEPAAEDVDRLIARTARGDDAAFEQLHSVTRPRLLGLALRILGNRSHAEDVLQEAYLTVWQRASERRPALGSGFGWMATIVRNRAIDRQRRLFRDPCIGGTDAFIEQFEAAARDTDERAVALGPLLARLSANHRAALRAAYFQGLSHREVADRLGVPLGTAKCWIRRGLLELRELLEPAQGERL